MSVFQRSLLRILLTASLVLTAPLAVARGKSSDAEDYSSKSSGPSAPSWQELDARPLPQWYDDAKFGIFIHWGVFSVPAFKNEWFWERWQGSKWSDYVDFVKRTEGPYFDYTQYAQRFTAEFYNPRQWADMFAKSGAQYVVLTSKHHEGFCNWNSTSIPTTWNWNAMDVGPKRDLVGELASAVKQSVSAHTNKKITFGLYHSLYEWFNPLYLHDQRNNFATQDFVNEKSLKELYDLVERYEPEVIWSDGEWSETSDYWRSREFLLWYSTNSSVADTAVWNDRWGKDADCKHGAFLTCADRYQPDSLQPRKWEDALTIDKTSWGYNRVAAYADYMTVKEIIDTLVATVAKNGNMLLNVGPAADGTIHPIFEDRLMGIGEWLKVNGPAIYGTKPWKICQNETASSVYYTRKQRTLFAHFSKWPKGGLLNLECPIPTSVTRASFLGYPPLANDTMPLEFSAGSASSGRRTVEQMGGMQIKLPTLTPDTIPCRHSWVIVITGLLNIE